MNVPDHLSEYIEDMPHLWVRFIAQRAIAKAHKQARITDGSIQRTTKVCKLPSSAVPYVISRSDD